MPPIKKFIAKGRILGLTTKFRSLKSLENWRVCFDVCLQFWPNFACDDQSLKLSHLFRNKKFVLNEMFQRIASKFAIFYVYENPKLLFSFRAWTFFTYECPGIVDIDQGIS